jgi:hypothetical protein
LTSDTSVPKPPNRASFWEKLSPRAQRALERQGVQAGETIPPPPALPSLSSSAPPPNRESRRALEQLERRPRRSSQYERDKLQLLRDGRRMQKLRATIESRGGDCSGGVLPVLIQRSVLVLCRTIMGDPSGFAVRAAFRRTRNKVAVGAIRQAALVPDAEGTARYTWADERARCVAALGLALLELSVPTARVGTWSGIVRGIPRGALCALLSSPWEPDRRKSVSSLVGTHRADGSLQNGKVGYLRALIEAGFCYSQQLPAADVQPFERLWPSGYASNRYWIVGETPTAPLSDATKRELLELHARGLDAHRERLQRARRAFLRRPLADVDARAAAALGGLGPPAPD